VKGFHSHGIIEKYQGSTKSGEIVDYPVGRPKRRNLISRNA
jgi:hypothetical protein